MVYIMSNGQLCNDTKVYTCLSVLFADLLVNAIVLLTGMQDMSCQWCQSFLMRLEMLLLMWILEIKAVTIDKTSFKNCMFI